MGKLIPVAIIIGLALVALVASSVLSRDAVGVLVGVLVGLLSIVPPTLLIVATAGSSDRVQEQRPALPEPPPHYGRILVERTPVRPPPLLADVDGSWRQLDD